MKVTKSSEITVSLTHKRSVMLMQSPSRATLALVLARIGLDDNAIYALGGVKLPVDSSVGLILSEIELLQNRKRFVVVDASVWRGREVKAFYDTIFESDWQTYLWPWRSNMDRILDRLLRMCFFFLS